jgi:hypothetical protein
MIEPDDRMLADPAFRRYERVLTWIAAAVLVLISVEGVALFLYFVLRYGWQ